jgi:hypothetical protein
VIAIALSMLLEFKNYSLRTKLVIALVTVAVFHRSTTYRAGFRLLLPM